MSTSVAVEPEHYSIGGSTIKRTELCAGSVAAIAALPFKSSSAAAERGTRIHAWLEKYLKSEFTMNGKLSPKDKEECLIAMEAGKVIKQLAAELTFDIKDLIIEHKMKMVGISEIAGGTPDVGAFAMGKDLVVWDLKAGSRIVFAEDNDQLAFYAVCFLQNMPEDVRNSLVNFHGFIIQPESDAPYHVHVRHWSISIAELVSVWEAKFKRIIAFQQANPHHRVAGDHCEALYCDARHQCAEYTAWLDGRSLNLFSKLLIGEVIPMPTDVNDIATLLAIEPKFKDFFSHLKEASIATLKENPGAIPGFTLVDTLGNRKWENEKFVEKKAKEYGLKIDDFKPRSLVGPAEFEKLMKAGGLTGETPPTTRASSGVKLVASNETTDALTTFAQVAPPPVPVAPPTSMFAGLI